LQPFENKALLIKTHEQRATTDKSIYVLRDARPVALSLYNFFDRRLPLEDVIRGNHRWGKWVDYVGFWTKDLPGNRLVLRYEDLKDELDKSLVQISTFLDVEIRTNQIPHRDVISDGKWVNKEKKSWRDLMAKHHVELCTDINQALLEKYGYI
jgi:hypothetical protein